MKQQLKRKPREGTFMRVGSGRVNVGNMTIGQLRNSKLGRLLFGMS